MNPQIKKANVEALMALTGATRREASLLVYLIRQEDREVVKFNEIKGLFQRKGIPLTGGCS